MTNKRFLFLMMWLAVLAGVVFGGFQFSLLKMATELGISSTVMGSMVSAFFAAVTVSPLLTGSLADRQGKRLVLLLTLLALSAGSVICICSHTVGVLFLGIAAAGLGTGSLESMMTAAMSDCDPQRAGKNVNITQGVLSLGCCVTPLVLDGAAGLWGYGWRLLFGICLVGALSSATLVLVTRFPQTTAGSSKGPGDSEPKTGGYRGILGDRLALAFIACIFVYMFMENGVTYFTDSFFALDLGRGDMSALALSLLWLAMAAARFVSAALYRYENAITIGGFALAAAALVSLFFLRQIPAVLAVYLLIGICFAPLWPFLAGRLNRRFPESTGTISGIVLAVGGAGGMISPYLMGVCADLWSVSGGFLIVAAMTVIGGIVFTGAACVDLRSAAERREGRP